MDKEFSRLLARVARNISVAESGVVHEEATAMQNDRTPLAELINYVIATASAANASDIHIEPMATGARIRLRLDGELRDAFQIIPAELYRNLVSRVKILCRMDIAETRLPQDGRFTFWQEGKDLDMRVSIVPVIYGEKIVMRILNNQQSLKNLEQLDLTENNKAILLAQCHKANGALLITGPVNSGKTTLMYAIMQKLNHSERNLISIEDPVEYKLLGVNQIQVNEKINLTFEAALKAVLRQDFDCLGVGEIRSRDTAEMMITAALTGRMVFSTLHTAGAVKTIFRLMDMGIPGYLLAVALSVVVSQRLVKRLCPYCRQAYKVKADSMEAKFLGEKYEPDRVFYLPEGCDKCKGTGYAGRVAVHEVLVVNANLSNAISQGKSLEELEQLAITEGMIPMKEDAIGKAKEGLTDLKSIMTINYGD